MDYVSGVLKDLIYKKGMTFQQMIDIGLQIVQAVNILHQSNIVHRDIKPDNVLVDEMNNLKLIDFGESAVSTKPFSESKNNLGCTLPYSPIECLLGKEEGFNNKQIDLWSISIIFYEMAFKNIPIFYTRWIGLEILYKWKMS